MFAKFLFLHLTLCILILAGCGDTSTEVTEETLSSNKAASSEAASSDSGSKETTQTEDNHQVQSISQSDIGTGIGAGVSQDAEVVPPASSAEAETPNTKEDIARTVAPDEGNDASTQPAVTQETSAVEQPSSHDWNVDYGASSLSFTGTQTGNKFTGKFEKFDAKIRLNPEDLSTAIIEVSIDMSSAKTGDRQRDDAIPGKDWFDVKMFPKAQFLSSSIVRVEGDEYSVAGTLTIRDISKDVSLPFTVKIEGDEAMATGGLSVQRNGFGIGQGQWASDEWVKFDVGIDFTINAQRQ